MTTARRARPSRPSSAETSSGNRPPGPAWLVHPGFRRLLVGRLASQAADGLFEASLAGYVLFSPDRAANAPTIAVGLAVVLLPFSLIGPFAGLVLDRFDRRTVLIRGGQLRSLLALATAVVLAGRPGTGAGLVGLAALAIGILAVSRLVLSGLSAALPDVVDPDGLVAAQGLATTAGTLATAGGAAAGAGVHAAAGSGDRALAAVAVVAAVGYLMAAAAGSWSRPGTLGPPVPQRSAARSRPALAEALALWAAVAEGARHLWQRPAARAALLAVNVSRLGYGVVFISTLLVFRHRHDGSFPGLSAVAVGLGLGTAAGALLAPRAARARGRSSVVSAGLVLGGGTALALAPPGSAVLLVVAAPLLGTAQQLAKVTTDALVQTEVDDDHRGRVFSLVDMGFSVSYSLAGAAAAVVLPDNGRAPVAVSCAAALWLVAGLAHLVLTGRGPSGRPFEQGGDGALVPERSLLELEGGQMREG